MDCISNRKSSGTSTKSPVSKGEGQEKPTSTRGGDANAATHVSKKKKTPIAIVKGGG